MYVALSIAAAVLADAAIDRLAEPLLRRLERNRYETVRRIRKSRRTECRP